jgi:hypothetical protein
MATARHLSFADITQLIEDLKIRAHGDGHVANQAAAQLLGLAQAALPEGQDEDDGDDVANLNAAQRAARRALLQRLREEAEAATEAGQEDRAEQH